MCLPMMAGGPLIVEMKPILTGCCAEAVALARAAMAASAMNVLFILSSSGKYSALLDDGYDSKVLRLSRVTQRFGARTVLNEVSLDLAAGEYVAVVGESGIG